MNTLKVKGIKVIRNYILTAWLIMIVAAFACSCLDGITYYIQHIPR